jgi:hypothetical protein
MTYNYNKYSRVYLVSLFLFVLFSILNYERLIDLFCGDLNTRVLIFLILQIVVLPIISLLMGMHKRGEV